MMRTVLLLALLLLLIGLSGPGRVVGNGAPAYPSGPLPPSARHIILFIGDGMGEGQRTAARWQARGREGRLVMDEMAVAGRAGTASANSPVTDSAASATALATGVKTNNGVIGMDPALRPLPTILEVARAQGMAVGLVTTVQLTHATPAAFAAHVPNRGMTAEIARQMMAGEIDLLLGGGEGDFLPTTATGCYPAAGKRPDGRNLIEEATAAGYRYVCDAAGLAAIDPASTSRLLGLFGDEEMLRPFSPSLAEMTRQAIALLSRDPEGFFLMVEGGQIDWASHRQDGANAIGDTLGLDEAVAVATEFARAQPESLIIVTADHETGGMAVTLQSSGAPNEDGPFFMPDGSPFFVNWSTTSHTSTPVPTTAQGPGSARLAGPHDNTDIYHAMYLALPRPWSLFLPLMQGQGPPER